MTENNREDKRSSCIHPSIRAWSLGSQAFSNSPSTCAAAFGRNGVLGGMSSPKLVENTQQQETKSNFQNLWRLIRGTFSHRGHTAHCSTVFFCLIEIDWILVGANWSEMRDPEPFAAYDVLADYKNLPGRQSATLSECSSKSPLTEGHVHLARTVRHQTWEEVRLCGFAAIGSKGIDWIYLWKRQ